MRRLHRVHGVRPRAIRWHGRRRRRTLHARAAVRCERIGRLIRRCLTAGMRMREARRRQLARPHRTLACRRCRHGDGVVMQSRARCARRSVRRQPVFMTRWRIDRATARCCHHHALRSMHLVRMRLTQGIQLLWCQRSAALIANRLDPLGERCRNRRWRVVREDRPTLKSLHGNASRTRTGPDAEAPCIRCDAQDRRDLRLRQVFWIDLHRGTRNRSRACEHIARNHGDRAGHIAVVVGDRAARAVRDVVVVGVVDDRRIVDDPHIGHVDVREVVLRNPIGRLIDVARA